MKSKKKNYYKPKLRVIKLASEEVLGSGCNKYDGSLLNTGQPLSCDVGNCHSTINYS